MKKILITGAAGTIGQGLIKYLLSEGRYDITALDLKNKKVYKRLKRYNKRINIIYGDVLDRNLIEDLIKNVDIVIHLTTCMPLFAEFNRNLVNTIEYDGIENIIKAVNYYNSKCHLIYASSTGVDCVSGDECNYLECKKSCEKLICKNLKKYTIIRVPIVLSDIRNDNYILNFKNDDLIETISKEDAAYAFCKAAYYSERLNRKIINIGGGANCVCYGRELKINYLICQGLTFKYFFNSLFVPHNYVSPVLGDEDEYSKLLNYRNDSIQSYVLRQKRRSKNRKFNILLAKPIIKKLNKNRNQ